MLKLKPLVAPCAQKAKPIHLPFDVRHGVANIATICAAVMIPAMFSGSSALANDMDRVVKMEERDIPELVLQIAKENNNNNNNDSTQGISGLMHIIDQIEEEITYLQEAADTNDVYLSEVVIDAQLEMLKGMM